MRGGRFPYKNIIDIISIELEAAFVAGKYLVRINIESRNIMSGKNLVIF